MRARRLRNLGVVAVAMAFVASSNALAAAWGPIVPLTSTTDANIWPGSIGASGSTVHVVYRQLDVDGRIVQYRRSTDGGTTWNDPIEISRPAATESARSTLAVNAAIVDVAWVEGDLLSGPTRLYHRFSIDGGTTWSEPKAVSPSDTNLVGFPTLARTGAVVLVAYTDWETGQVYVQRSSDGGASWGGRTPLGSSTQLSTDVYFDGEPDLAFGTGVGYAVWKASESELRVRRTLDGGVTWTAPVVLDSDAYYGVRVAAVGTTAAVAYEYFDPAGTTNSYAALRTSGDSGAHWNARVRVSSGIEPAWPADLVRAGGKWRLVYEQCVSEECDTGWALWYRDSADGSAWSTATRFNNVDLPEPLAAGGAFASNVGRFIVAWAGFEFDASDADIYVRWLDGQATFWSGPVFRLSGSDRYSTAVAISKSTFKDSPVPIAYVATGSNFPDALAAGPAAALEGGPVLLVATDSIPTVVRTELQRLQPLEIRVMGGPSVVSEAVVTGLRQYTSGSVTRLAGTDRYGTAGEVIRTSFTGYQGPVFVAFGGNFPDALAGGPAAASIGAPIILTTTTDVPNATVAALSRMTPQKFVLLGSAAVIGTGVVNELKALYPSVPIVRWSGPDRYATSAAIAGYAFPGGADVVFVATGTNFPDALAGVPAAANANAPILLSQSTCIPQSVASTLLALDPGRVIILGGPSVVSSAAPTLVCGTSP